MQLRCELKSSAASSSGFACAPRGAARCGRVDRLAARTPWLPRAPCHPPSPAPPPPARNRSCSEASGPAEWQRVEALALELDILNWVLGEGPPFSRRAFWREALPKGVAMLRACDEAAELDAVLSACWRPTIEHAYGSAADDDEEEEAVGPPRTSRPI